MKADDKQTGAQAAPAAETIEQVRELLFGADKRKTDDRLSQLDAKFEKLVADLRADLVARFTDLESRLDSARSDLENNRLASIDEIGSAIANLGSTIRNLGAKPRGR